MTRDKTKILIYNFNNMKTKTNTQGTRWTYESPQCEQVTVAVESNFLSNFKVTTEGFDVPLSEEDEWI